MITQIYERCLGQIQLNHRFREILTTSRAGIGFQEFPLKFGEVVLAEMELRSLLLSSGVLVSAVMSIESSLLVSEFEGGIKELLFLLLLGLGSVLFGNGSDSNSKVLRLFLELKVRLLDSDKLRLDSLDRTVLQLKLLLVLSVGKSIFGSLKEVFLVDLLNGALLVLSSSVPVLGLLDGGFLGLGGFLDLGGFLSLGGFLGNNFLDLDSGLSGLSGLGVQDSVED